MPEQYESPEEAAIGDIPTDYATVLFTSKHSDWAVVLLKTNDRPPFELYEVVCHYDEDGWNAMIGSNGSGWNDTDDESGVMTLWGEASSDIVTIRFREKDYQAPSSEGYFFFCEWVDDEEIQEYPIVVSGAVEATWSLPENGRIVDSIQ